MKILVAVASRHGSTADIARRLAARLDGLGHSTTVVDLVHERAVDGALAGHDAAVIGSAIYESHWLRAARSFVVRNAARLRRMPVFLFSSGPIGESEHVSIDTAKIDELVHAVDAIEHRVFSGKLERAELGRLERWIVDVVRAREGDFREWEGIDHWATVIDDTLTRAVSDRA